MGGQGRLLGGLALCLMGVLGVCVTCGLPMWRETSFVGANIVTAQTVWDGLWLHCVFQSTGQMQCKRHKTFVTLTSDIQGGRALSLLAILFGLLGFVAALLGGGAVNCSGDGGGSERLEPPSASSSKKKASVLGGLLSLLAGVLILISVSWSAAATLDFFNDPLVPAALKREVGSSVYIGWASSALLLLAGALFCAVCGREERPLPSYYYLPYNSSTQVTDSSTRMATRRAELTSPDVYAAQVNGQNSRTNGFYGPTEMRY
ncbi:unnamed protein product [Ophioblennius macclurei]